MSSRPVSSLPDCSLPLCVLRRDTSFFDKLKPSRARGSSRPTLTEDHEDEEQGGHARRDVEHDADVIRQLVHVVHVGHQDGGDEEPDGDAQLEGNEENTN